MLERVPLCHSQELSDSGRAVAFDVVYGGQSCRAFAIRHQGVASAYLNRCAHVAMEMDLLENRFFDPSGTMLVCSTHGALYAPESGACLGGPCRAGLVKIELSESDGLVHWHTAFNLRPVEF